MHPTRDGVIALVRRPHHRLGALDQQRAQVVVAAFGDASQAGLAAGGVLAGYQTEPGAELPRIYFLDNGILVKKVDYFELNQYNIEEWIKTGKPQ
jgi:hypothetical protein